LREGRITASKFRISIVDSWKTAEIKFTDQGKRMKKERLTEAKNILFT
jgi:hypothetical protein